MGAFEAGSTYAHAINTVKMAVGFARLGHKVTIACRRPRAGPLTTETTQRVYGFDENIRWLQLPNISGLGWCFAALLLPSIVKLRPDLVFARNYAVPALTSTLGIPTVVESHAHPDTWTPTFRAVVAVTKFPAFRLWVTIGSTLASYYRKRGVPAGKLVVLATGADLQRFERPSQLPPSPYPPSAPVAAYVGHLYDYKGIPDILSAAALLPDIQFHLVGGRADDIARQEKRTRDEKLENVTFHGAKQQRELPAFLWHADVLLLPPSARHPSAEWTSPVKLGEYLASGKPTVATAIPALRHWLTEDEVEFCEADNPSALAAAIERVVTDRKRAMSISDGALQKASDWSYDKRAERILTAALRLDSVSHHGQGGHEDTSSADECVSG